MRNLPISSIRLDGGTQTRAALDLTACAEYADAMKAGAVFPPVTVFHDGTDYWLADGFHRIDAARLAGLQDVPADVRQGTQRDARLHAVGANQTHGLRRTNADRRRAIMALLNDPEWSTWSNREIAQRCGASHTLVAQMRSKPSGNIATPWIPKADHQAIGHGHSRDGIPMLAYVVPFAADRGKTRLWWWVVIVKVRDGDDQEGDVIYTKRPIPHDWILPTLEREGFPAQEASWGFRPASDESDEFDEGIATEKKWSWPHIAFHNRQEWIEKRWEQHTGAPV